MYLAVEPYARRLRPWTLVSWTHFLGGGFTDPVVGRDVLAGVAWALLMFYLGVLRYALPPLVGLAPPEPGYSNLDALVGVGPLASVAMGAASDCILFTLGGLLLFVLLRTLLRRDALAVVALTVVLMTPHGIGMDESAWLALPISAALNLTWILLLLRFGLLAAWVGEFVYDVLTVFPITTDLASWKAGPTLFALPLLALLCIAASRNTLGGTGLRRYLAPEPSSRP